MRRLAMIVVGFFAGAAMGFVIAYAITVFIGVCSYGLTQPRAGLPPHEEANRRLILLTGTNLGALAGALGVAWASRVAKSFFRSKG